MGQRLLLWLFRSFAVVLVLAGLVFLGGWRLGELVAGPQPGFWSAPILEFLFRLGATWLAAGVVAPLLLWSIRAAPPADAAAADQAPGVAGLPALMPLFLALAALLAAAASGPVLGGWREGLALIERFELWDELSAGGEGLLALIPIAAVLFVPVMGSATLVSFLAGTATAVAFRDKGIRFVRIYAAWMVIHAALVLATVYSSDLLGDLSGPWLDPVRPAAEAADGPSDGIPPEARLYLEDWVPAAVARNATQAARGTWISIAYAVWIPFLLIAARQRSTFSRRPTSRAHRE
ncbi:MAG: hypothetical protein PVJ43_14105 [Gemmatimonadales bacterium]|jgi:hypothetical protein